MTSKLVVNTIEADTGISSVSFASSISLSSTSKFHFSAAGIDIDADTNINRPAAGVIGFNINSSEKARIDSSGRVLIGTTTEGHTSGDDLTIATSDTTGITLRGGSSGGGRIFFSDDTSGTAEYEGVVGYDHGTNHLYFSTNHAEKLRIDSSGNMGQGTVTPTTPDGSNADNSNNGKVLTIYGDSPAINLIHNTAGGGSAGSTDYAAINFGRNGSSSNPYRAVIGYKQVEDILHVNAQNHIVFETGGNINTGEALRIKSDGNIGVAGDTGTDFSLLDGIVINTANGSAGLLINSSSSSHNAYMSFGYGSGSGTSHADQFSAYIGRVGDNNLIFGTNNSIRASIDSSGVFNLNNIVQVGTTNDTGELRIGHDGSNYRARIVSNSSNSLEIDADGPERIQMHGGVIYMRPINSEKSAAFVANGSAELYYDDVKKFQTSSSGSQVFGTFQSTPQNNSQKGAYFGPYVIDNSQSAQTDDTVDIRSLKGVALDLTRYYTSGDIQTFRINNDYEGAIYVSPTGVNYNSTSDYRLKENVINLTGAIDRVKQLKPKRFNFIKDPGNTIDGFMAHEVSSVVPNAVIGEKDATMTTYYDEGDTIPDGKVIGDVKENAAIDPQSMDDSRLVPLLTAALQEAITEIETLKTKVAALEGS